MVEESAANKQSESVTESQKDLSTANQNAEEEKESLVMDFSTAFKADTRRGKKKKKGVAQKAADSSQP